MSEDKTKKALSEVVNAGLDLAESVKYCIQHNESEINKDTVIALNRFVVAYNELANILVLLTDEENESNIKLN